MSSINTDIAQTLDITCRKGDTFAIDITFRDSSSNLAPIAIDSVFSFQMQVRSSDQDTGTPILGDSTSGTGSAGEITLTPGANGVLAVTIDDSVMKLVPSGNYVYDIQADKSGAIQTWVKGSFVVNEDVTDYASST